MMLFSANLEDAGQSERITERLSPPWETSVCGVVSLWEMQQFYGDFIVKFLSELSAWEVLAVKERREALANPEITVALCAKLGVLRVFVLCILSMLLTNSASG